MTDRIVEANRDTMLVLLVFVDQQNGPVSIGPQNRISGDECVPHAIVDVARGAEQPMLAVARLQPLQIDELTVEILGERLFDLQIVIHDEKSERADRTAAAGLRGQRPHWQRYVVEVIHRIAAAAQKRANIVSEPQPTPNVQVALRAL